MRTTIMLAVMAACCLVIATGLSFVGAEYNQFPIILTGGCFAYAGVNLAVEAHYTYQEYRRTLK